MVHGDTRRQETGDRKDKLMDTHGCFFIQDSDTSERKLRNGEDMAAFLDCLDCESKYYFPVNGKGPFWREK